MSVPFYFGCMRLAPWSEGALDKNTIKNAFNILDQAYDSGIRHFDHADIYGRGKCEEVFGLWLKERGKERRDLFIQSKCGIRFPGDGGEKTPGRYDFSYDHILKSVKDSLTRLGLSSLDRLLLHRPDILMNPREVNEAFDELYASEKVETFGLSNHSQMQSQLLQKNLDQIIQVNQLEISLLQPQILDAGIERFDGHPPSPTGYEGLLEYCQMNDIEIQAWSPLGKGYATGKAVHKNWSQEKQEQVITKQKLVEELSRDYDCSTEAIALSWLLKHPANIKPVICTSKGERLKRMMEAPKIDLSREDWYRLFISARGERLP